MNCDQCSRTEVSGCVCDHCKSDHQFQLTRMHCWIARANANVTYFKEKAFEARLKGAEFTNEERLEMLDDCYKSADLMLKQFDKRFK